MDISTFRQRFKELDETERIILKLLTITYEPVNQTTMVNILRECDIRTERSTQILGPQVKEYRELLDAGGWLYLGPKGEMQVADKFRELVMRMAVVDKDFRGYVRNIQKVLPYREWMWGPRNFEVCIRELRIALYEGNVKRVEEVIADVERYHKEAWAKSDFFKNFFTPFNAEWLATFPDVIQGMALNQLISQAIQDLAGADPFIKFLEENNWFADKEKLKSIIGTLTLYHTVRGDFEVALKLAETDPQQGFGRYGRMAVPLYFKGENKLVNDYLEESVRQFRKDVGLRKGTLPNFQGIVHVLTVLKQRDKDYLNTALKLVEETPMNIFSNLFSYLKSGLQFQLNNFTGAQAALNLQPDSPLDWIFYGAAHYWNDLSLEVNDLIFIKNNYLLAAKNRYRWIEMELATLLAIFEQEKTLADEYAEVAAKLRESLRVDSITAIFPKTEAWERSLEALLQIQAKKGKKANVDAPEKQTRLVWWVDFQHNQVQPVEQTFGKGAWSKGRNVALKRLKEAGVDNMTDQDKEAAKSIKLSNHGYYGGVEYFFDFEKLMPALVGHPLLFLLDNPSISVELVAQQPQIHVEQVGDDYVLRFSHEFSGAGVQLTRETPTRYVLLKVSEQHAEINRLLDHGRLRVPPKGKQRLIEAVGNLSTIVTVQSEVGGESVNLPTIEGNPVTFVHLLPVGNGFKMEFFVKPFTTEPPYFKPGVGRESVIAEVQGQPMKATRDLRKEKENAKRVEAACPTFLRTASENREWLFDEAEDALNALLELEPLRSAGEVVMEHPKGEKLRIAGQVGFDQLSIGIKKERDWFSMDGKVQVNENLVMDFRQLLDLAQNAKGRFVQLNDGQFLALTSQLQRKLEELNNIFTKTKNDLRFHPLAAHSLEGFTDLLHDVELDAAWKKQLSRLRESREINPKVPSTFKAELRSYQEDGFRWLSQLAYWGVGACLADDMGLGKTVQALALLLDRAKLGPALVCAPASVVRNWYHEAVKFTPTLRPLVFGEADRKETLESLQPFDLLLCSYGLMQQESELLTETHFATIVLDEAQAIKNRATKRSQTAMLLQGDFKIITTGTPVENHLGELWNLFNFLNPGLLGSLDRFNENFAVPIEKLQDRERRNQLKRHIQPFILRRRKNDVLAELPEKTEITLTVELSQEERAFYEALRRKAIENIEGTKGGDPADKRFKILAELMRLRQAACHPRLIQPESELSSSKLNLFAETVEELIGGGHKALVFSQFVRHLALIEEWAKSKGISYQYLDGSTPLPQRDKAIRAFQGGEGDLFLISLKAGGFGLNLTAADYVIHLDPWWNPAVEDQASDRAHRIGQLRPVTIYRLVAEDTIEEKIVKLHADKRELADSLLDGTEMSGKLNAEELLELIKG
ncbi:MAG: DEAD/DEAH box helicase [Saprospiraceae bacterium]|nr:DEAD/DEAH box helicase [Saprospiraceae bacterium]